MSGVRREHWHSRSHRSSWAGETLRNVLRRAGLAPSSSRHSAKQNRFMSLLPDSLRRFLPTLPRDYIRRRKALRKIRNSALLFFLSIIVAYAITRPSGGPGFSLPASVAKTAVAEPSSMAEVLPLPTAAHSSVDPESDGTNTSGYDLGQGPYAVVEVSDAVLHDAKRNKDLHLRLIYPKNDGKYPVIIFSHGAGGSQSCCDLLTRHWASYGYVALQPTHEDSLSQRQASEDVGFLQAVRDALHQPKLWRSRPEDISFLLDSLPELVRQIPSLAGKIDVDRVGVGGHSMGSFTAEAIAGALVDLPGQSGTDFTDSRVKAVLCLSPQGPGQFGLNEHSFDRMKLPYLGVTGSQDSLGPMASPAWHKIPFERSQSGDKYHVLIQGANHMSFVRPVSSGFRQSARSEPILDYTNSFSLAFWDAYLKSNERARKFLRSDALHSSSEGAVTLDRR